ncbi:MAG: class I SAM-dependent methyltransferase [Tenacibaculum sp.]
MDTKQGWFTLWFNTPYYHILYKHRDNSDAEFFMRNICSFINLPKGSFVADIPCGKGRHAVYLNSLGFRVKGGDLSPNNIDFARQFENKTLSFEVWDMRKPLECKYDAIFNLFTSYGYFEEENDDILVLKNFKNGLKKGGKLVFDFLNVEKIKANLVLFEEKQIDGINFSIRKEIKGGYILKHISFFADQNKHFYTERVKLLNIEKLKTYFNCAGFVISHIFGSYDLDPFDKKNSDRLIFIAQ